MLSELVDMAFELFSQGKRSAGCAQGGLRIGPALVRRLIQLPGGSLALHSAGLGLGLGLGSKVSVLLPSLQQGDKLPCVDDKVDAAQLLGMFLELLGRKVFIQFHPANAYQMRARNAARPVSAGHWSA